MKGFLKYFFGFVIIIMFGFLAAVLTPIFAQVAPQYNTTIQLIIMIIIPVIGFAVLWGFFGSDSG